MIQHASADSLSFLFGSRLGDLIRQLDWHVAGLSSIVEMLRVHPARSAHEVLDCIERQRVDDSRADPT
jgi:hypothetical protein